MTEKTTNNELSQRSDPLSTRDLLTVEQAAAYLQLSPSSIRAYIRKGNIKAFRIAGKRKVLIPRAALNVHLMPIGGGTTA